MFLKFKMLMMQQLCAQSFEIFNVRNVKPREAKIRNAKVLRREVLRSSDAITVRV
jgi:hypothetical protein